MELSFQTSVISTNSYLIPKNSIDIICSIKVGKFGLVLLTQNYLDFFTKNDFYYPQDNVTVCLLFTSTKFQNEYVYLFLDIEYFKDSSFLNLEIDYHKLIDFFETDLIMNKEIIDGMYKSFTTLFDESIFSNTFNLDKINTWAYINIFHIETYVNLKFANQKK